MAVVPLPHGLQGGSIRPVCSDTERLNSDTAWACPAPIASLRYRLGGTLTGEAAGLLVLAAATCLVNLRQFGRLQTGLFNLSDKGAGPLPVSHCLFRVCAEQQTGHVVAP